MAKTARIERLRQNYVNTKPAICYERARIWTESHKRTEGEPIPIRRAQAFYDFCNEFDIKIFEDELIIGTAGKFRRSGILTPEFSWKWVDVEMDMFDKRPQDPYEMTDEQRDYVRKNIFPYWEGKSLEEHFLSILPEDTAKIGVDTGIIDNDSKWRQAVGEITPDYQDILFVKGFSGILKEAEEKLAKLSFARPEDMDKIIFYKSTILTTKGIMRFAERYSDLALKMSKEEQNPERAQELARISEVCKNVPKNPPNTFHEAIQFMWFVQLGGIISENPLALNPGRFDQVVNPYYEKDLEKGLIDRDTALELIEALWLKYSEWVWTISSNTAGFFAGYNQFQNLTVGGKDRDGNDATNEVSYMCLEATDEVRTHQPGLSVRIHQDCPQKFMDAVTDLVSKGTGFPAIHNDQAGTQMLLQAGYKPEDARDWSNCGCVVPHFRKTGEWTSAVNVNFAAAMEYAMNSGKSRLDGETYGLGRKKLADYTSFEELKDQVLVELDSLLNHSVISTLIAQKLHTELVPRPFLSTCVEDCMERGVDLAQGGAHYRVGPVLTGIGLAVVANSLAAIKKLVFEDKKYSLQDFDDAMNADWKGYEQMQKDARSCPKYGNDDEYVDSLAREVSNRFYRTTNSYVDIFGARFNSAFMGISNYIPTGKIVGATPCGREATLPITEGVSPYVGTDVTSPLAAMKSSAKMNHDVHTGGTLLNLRLSQDLVSTKKARADLGNIIKGYFSLGAFHVQFNTLSTDILRKAQEKPEDYKDLLIRVAGYSTQFVNLSPVMQEAIIARTEHSNM